MFCTRLAIWFETCSISSSAAPGILREQGSADHVRRAALHRHDGFIGIGLDGAHQDLYLFGRVCRTLREALHLIRHNRETASRLSGHRGLNRGVQRQNIRLLGDIVDEFDDIADFLRAFAEPLDALARLLNGFANGVHAVDGAPHRIAALVSDVDRMPGDVRAALGIARHLLDGGRHIRHGLAGRSDLPGLRAARLGHMRGRRLRLLRGAVQLDRAFVDRRNQFAQRLDGIVYRVGDRARNVLGNRRLHRQIAVSETR